MAKDEINRATRAEAGDVVGAPKQQDVAELLKKMKVVAEAEAKAAHPQASDEQAAAADQASVQANAGEVQADASQMVASADSIFASDVAPVEVAMLDGGSVGGGGGVSTGTLLAIGGVALVGGGIAIAANNDSGGGGNKSVETTVTAGAASVNEGNVVNFSVKGTPGTTVSWSVDAAHTGDVTVSAGSIELDSNGNGVISITTVADNTTEGAETLTLTVLGDSNNATASVTINDTSLTPVAANEDLTILTDGAPTFDFSGTTGANVVGGVADGGNPFTETFSVGDHVIGNGQTILDLKVASGGNEAVASLEHMGAINLVNVAGVTNATFDATLWSDIGSINLVDGQDGLQAAFLDLEQGVDMSIASGVAGTLYASFTDLIQASLSAGRDSSIAWVANNVDANIVSNEGGNFHLFYSDVNPIDVTLGSVDAAVGSSAGFSLTVTNQGGAGAITVGDVGMTAGTSSDLIVQIGSVNGGTHTVDVGDVSLQGTSGDSAFVGIGLSQALAGDVTVGNVAVEGFVNVDLAIGRNSATMTGNVTVGDLTVSVLDGGSLGNNFATIANAGSTSVGDLVVGDISLTLGQTVTGGHLYIYNSATATGADDALAGDVAVGNIDLKLDTSAELTSFTINNYASATSSGDATVGNLSVGNISADLAVAATANVYISNSATVSFGPNGGVGTVGDLSVGDIDATLNDGAYLYVYARNDAEHGGNGGDVTLGDITVDSANGVNAVATVSVDAFATSSGSIGEITIGNVTATVGETGEFYEFIEARAGSIGGFSQGDVSVNMIDNTAGSSTATLSVDLSATTGNLGDVSFGNVNASAGVSASFSLNVSLDSLSGDIGDITFGNIDLQAVGTSASASVSLSATADKNIGDVTFGDISLLSSGTTASATVNVNLSAGANIGDISVGSVDVVAVGSSASASANFTITAGSDIGDVTFGDISMKATGSATGGTANADFTLDISAPEIGAITLGDITLSAAVASASATADAEVYFGLDVSNTFGGDVTVGDVELNLAAANGTGTGSATVTVSVDVDGDLTIGDIAINLNALATTALAVGGTNNIFGSITAGGNISVGTISVSGGDGSLDNLDIFTNVLSVFTGGPANLTVAGVDYSGYLKDVPGPVPGLGTDTTIDVSLYNGFATIIGSGFDDAITDNAGKNVITGGAGMDIFNFVNTNTGLTAATADQITDWVKADDEINVGFAPVDGTNYTELGGSYADFAAFLTAANGAVGNDAGGKVVVGVVAGTVCVAVENVGLDAHAGVDYVVQLNGVSNLNAIDVNDFS